MLTTSDYVEVDQGPSYAMPLAVRRLVIIRDIHCVLYCAQKYVLRRAETSFAKALKVLESASITS